MKCKFANFVLSFLLLSYVISGKKMAIGTMLELILLCYLSSEI